jgi:hypothetical protein
LDAWPCWRWCTATTTAICCAAADHTLLLAAPVHTHTPTHTHHAPPRTQAARAANRLQFLLRQAEIFQHFAPATIEKAKK